MIGFDRASAVLTLPRNGAGQGSGGRGADYTVRSDCAGVTEPGPVTVAASRSR